MQPFKTISELSQRRHERFLRKFCGYSVTEFAEIMGSSKSVVCRWETSNHGAGTDRTVRLLVMTKLVREIAGQPEPNPKNVLAEGCATYHNRHVRNLKVDHYRAKSACMVHKATGDPEQVCKEGLAVFEALAPARERANSIS